MQQFFENNIHCRWKSKIYCENAVAPDLISDSNEVGVRFKNWIIIYKCTGFFLKCLPYKPIKTPSPTITNTTVFHTLPNITIAPTSVTATLTTTGLQWIILLITIRKFFCNIAVWKTCWKHKMHLRLYINERRISQETFVIFKTSWRRLQDMSWIRLQHVLSVTVFRFQDVWKTCWRCIWDVLEDEKSSRSLGDKQNVYREYLCLANLYLRNLYLTNLRRIQNALIRTQ